MRRLLIHWKSVTGILLMPALFFGFLTSIALPHTIVNVQAAGSEQSTNTYQNYVSLMAKQHKAPFFSQQLVTDATMQAFARKMQHTPAKKPATNATTNIKVNQDHNGWPKAGVSAAIDPINGNNMVVATSDFRQNFNHVYYHITTDGGRTWSDDTMAAGIDTATFAPYDYQSNPGSAFDREGHVFFSNISGNTFSDATTGYFNFDSEIEVVQGTNNGNNTSIVPTSIDYAPCHGIGALTTDNCAAAVDKPLITVDTVNSSPTKNSIYVYYTYFCHAAQPCKHDTITVPAYSSVILESDAAGVNLPFSPPKLASGPFTQAQFADMVIDSRGMAHIFFEDFTNYPTIAMYESSLVANTWTVNPTPVTTFQYSGLSNPNWQFRDRGTIAPGCSIFKNTAYCAFSATQVGSGKVSGAPSVYLATVNTTNSAATIARVNNDAFDSGKDHIFPWASTDTRGNVYVGWYDGRKDPLNIKLEYFVGKSTDGGQTFPKQQAVSATPFNPCIGTPNCVFFGDYNQLVTGPDDVTHAIWSDTRDSASMQIYTQALKWN
ncbi:hypothetical protein KSF_012490 [Reticulibacter mediterranei]|uniref:Exo-alpha-sialidase n=1 Tax=Reticulibacter mediterranei TaxID=2778369 RepID=A0A8J3IJA4_9CHLR|nr:hypothetical protein [Reticulibacter mediterranei]GHO91201.1 hypothetical protein KSF_012490 [Reticulibacter mediterranei]